MLSDLNCQLIERIIIVDGFVRARKIRFQENSNKDAQILGSSSSCCPPAVRLTSRTRRSTPKMGDWYDQQINKEQQEKKLLTVTSLKVLCPVSPVVLGLCPVSRGRDLTGAPQDATVARWRQTMRQMKAKILEVTVLYSCRRWWGVAVPRWAVVQSIRFRPQNRLPQASTGAARGINYFSPHLSHDQSLILPCRGNIDWVIRRHFRRYRGDL